MDVVDGFDPVVLLQSHLVESGLRGELGEGRGQLRQRFDGRPGTHMLIAVEHGDAVDVLDRDDRIFEEAVLPGRSGALLRFGGEGVHFCTAEALCGGDEVGTDSLGHEVRVVVRRRILRPGSAVGSQRHAGHRLDTSGKDEALESGADLLCSDVDGFEPGGTEPVDLNTGNGLVESGDDGGDSGDIRALLADRRHNSEHDVVDGLVVKVGVALAEGIDEPCHEIDGFDAVQRSAAVLSARRAHRIIDVRFAHVVPTMLIDRSVTSTVTIQYQIPVRVNTDARPAWAALIDVGLQSDFMRQRHAATEWLHLEVQPGGLSNT